MIERIEKMGENAYFSLIGKNYAAFSPIDLKFTKLQKEG